MKNPSSARYSLSSRSQFFSFSPQQMAEAEPSFELKTGFEAIREWQIDKAREIAEELYKNYPSDPLVLSLLAQVKLQTSDYAGAVHYFNEAKRNGAPDIVLVDAPLAEAAKVATEGYVETISENFIVRHEPGKDADCPAVETLEMTLIQKLLGWKPLPENHRRVLSKRATPRQCRPLQKRNRQLRDHSTV